MSIATRIESISNHIEQAYDELQGLGADLSNVNKNIENISIVLDNIYDSLPSVSDEGTSLTLDDTRVGKIKSTLKGNTSQTTYSGKNLLKNTLLTTATTTTGVTATPNSDGSVTLNGTATAVTYFNLSRYDYGSTSFSSSYGGPTDYIASIGVTQTGVALGFNGSNKYTALSVNNGVTVNNLKVYPMIRAYSVSDDTFEPYTGGQASPNPDYPQDVHVVSGDNTIKSCAKNLYNVNDRESVAQEVVIDNDSWISVSYDNTSGSSNKIFNCRMKPNIFLKPDTTYKIVVEVKSISGNGVLTINEGANQQSQIYDGFIKDFSALSSNSVVMQNAKTWASLEGKSRLSTQYVYFRPGQSGSITFRVSLIEDTTLTPSTFTYEPYQSQSYNVNLGSLELCKIGDYQDYFYKDNGKWYKYNAIGKKVLDGSEVWAVHGGIASWFYYDGIIDGYVLDNTQVLIKTNYYTPKAYQGVPNLVNGECSYGSSDSGITHRFVIKNTDYTQTNDFKNWLSAHNTEVYYVLANSTNTEITYQPLIDQLNKLEKAQSKDNQTNISQENDNLPFIINATALIKNSD